MNEIKIKARALRQAREQTQTLSQQAAAMLNISPAQIVQLAQMRIEIRAMKEELQRGDSRYMRCLLSIYDALGYAECDPTKEEILYAINTVHRKAIANGYTWHGAGYTAQGKAAVGLAYVQARVQAEMGVLEAQP